MASNRIGRVVKKTTPKGATRQAPTAAETSEAAPGAAATPITLVAAKLPRVPHRRAVPSVDNIAFEWRARGEGAGELVVVYEGPLAVHEGVVVRTGTCRAGGARWFESRDVALTRLGPHSLVATIALSRGAPVEAVELAFHAGDAWDNGGCAPLGYYEINLRDAQAVAC